MRRRVQATDLLWPAVLVMFCYIVLTAHGPERFAAWECLTQRLPQDPRCRPRDLRAEIRLSDPTKPIPHTFVPFYEPIGTLTKDVTIPETPSQEVGSIDLGVLKLHEK